jgi:signal transduction histidine kinase
MLSVSVFRDAVRKLSLRKKLTILASVGVLLPLLVLAYMQYRSLAELQNKTKGAFKDNLRQGLTNVEQQMKQRLKDIAAQAFNPIGNMDLSSAGAAEKLNRYYADVKRSQPAIKQIFVFGYSGDQLTPTESNLLFLFQQSPMAQSFLDGDRKYLFVHHSCPTCPRGGDMHQGTFLFYPLNDLRKEQSGFAGALLDEGFVRDGLLARSIGETFNISDSATSSSAIAITISDPNRQVLYSNAAAQNGLILESNFGPPFSNWKAEIGLKNTNLDELAAWNYWHSAASTFLVLVVLLGGIVLAIRATDREARLAQAKSNFVSNVSHELKTPLSLISLFSEILELGRVNNEEKKTEYYRIIRHESRRLNKTIDNILDFSRIEAGRKTYQLVDGDMAEVIDNVLSTHRYQIINSGFDIQTNIQRDLPPVLIDRDAMTQAISNLLDNAIKYSGKVKQLSITAKTLGSDLCIEIADHGIGIPRAEQEKIFEKFYRVGNGLVHDVKGSGLGLSLVKHIIEAHNGTISVESDVGSGSRFTILLPLVRRVADAQA